MLPIKIPPKRCAINTRKSSEEGLEQDFNSLHAQREACEAYIRSQKHEGWQPIKTVYDDGGFSGGNMERPALKQLMQDIADQKVDIIVVYKVDRLTRALSDFAKMVELFDKHNVSFVSVTQQFNTTSSMGRLTLNVLLSFAQFEREVTGERIRDKIAASKKKGMWMGGVVPLGYDVKERKLIINYPEAEIVRYIFNTYLDLGSVRLLQENISARGIRSKARSNTVKYAGGKILSRGTLYKMLSNPIYIGQIRHKSITHAGQHEAIIDQAIWGQVQQLLLQNGSIKEKRGRKTAPSVLSGKLFDESGQGLTPSHANKQGKRYRYYISRHSNNNTGWRLPAQELEQCVLRAAAGILIDEHAISAALATAGIAIERYSSIFTACKNLPMNDVISLIQQVKLHKEKIDITITLLPLLERNGLATQQVVITQEVPMLMKRRGIETRLVIGNQQGHENRIDNFLIKAIAKAQLWSEELTFSKVSSLAGIASREGTSRAYISRMMNLAFIAPNMIEAIVAGQQSSDITLEYLLKRTDLPLEWSEQAQLLGIRQTHR